MNKQINLSDVIFDTEIYPREKWNSKTVEVYADALKAGATFPPIILEEGTNRLLDGVHRWKAHLLYREWYVNRPPSDNGIADDWPVPTDEIEAEYHSIPEGTPPKLYASSLSIKHGDRIGRNEIRELAREIYQKDASFPLAILARYLPISKSALYGYVSDLMAKRKEEQMMTAYRLYRLGWTHEEVGKVIEVNQQNVSRDFYNHFPDLENDCKKSLNEGHPHLDVAERYSMPLQLVWAIDLEGRTDELRMERLGIDVQPYDVWNFGKCNDLFGSKHPGRIPGQLIAHVLYFFTAPGDTVIDPMAGSGTMADVCLAMGRKCYAYDIDSRHGRPDVIPHNLLKKDEETDQYWPHRIKKADLIFWDPPYFEKMDSENIGENGYIEGSISKLPRGEYLSFFFNRFVEAKKLVKKGTRLAFLMSDWDDDTGQREGVFVWDYASVIQKAGWKLTRHIQVPLSTQQVHPDIVTKFRKSRRLARLERYLLIGEV